MPSIQFEGNSNSIQFRHRASYYSRGSTQRLVFVAHILGRNSINRPLSTMTAEKDVHSDIRNAWESAPLKAGLVDTSAGHIFLTAQGAARQPGQPIVLFVNGVGEASTCWNPVARLLAAKARCLSFDRPGLRRSDASKTPRTAENMAAEIQTLLRVVNTAPPYVVVAHSYGGIVS